jgi:DNA polymerase-3 subunit alpha
MDDRPRHTIVLLAENETGYKNLLQLVSKAQLDGFYYKARIDRNLLRQYHEGLIALSGNMTGEIPANLIYDNYEAAKATAIEYREIFGERPFLPRGRTEHRSMRTRRTSTGTSSR